VSINWNRITNCQNDGHAILLNGVRSDPNIAIGWNEITNQFGRSKPADAINIYQSSGMPGAPILVHNNYIQGVAPPNLNQTGFTSSGIVTDGITHGDASKGYRQRRNRLQSSCGLPDDRDSARNGTHADCAS
jgi:hypothetical protein